MKKRPYQPVERQRTVDEGRQRILDAAQAHMQRKDFGFSLDAVARKAGVTRQTVYNQFGSKAGLLEELFDQVVTRGAFNEMPRVFTAHDAGTAFDELAAIFGRFYADNRAGMLQLRAAMGVDPDLDEAIRRRNARRRQGVEKLVQTFAKQLRPQVPATELVATLDTLLNFNTFDALAGPQRTPVEVVATVRQLLRGVLGLADQATARKR